MSAETWWDGVPCEARRVLVEVLPANPRAWYAPLVGTVRPAVEVVAPVGVPAAAPGEPGDVLWIDDERGWGWRKVTMMRGSRGVVCGRVHRVRVLDER